MKYLVKGIIDCVGIGYDIKKHDEIVLDEKIGKKLINAGYVELKKAIDETPVEKIEEAGGKKGGKK